MNTIRDLKLLPVWVNPQHLVATAAHVMAGHRVKAVGVLEGDTLVGTLSSEDVLVAPETAAVGAVMRPLGHVFQASTQIRAAAELFVAEDMEYAPAVDGDTYIGIVTPAMLLRELGRSYDPLTGLSWSDCLREWGVEHLKNGDEVTILFVDLNDFGLYNKRYGHIVGDRVLQRVTAFLSQSVSPDSEVLVRYGGDEFAIGTLRTREEADELADSLRRRMGTIFVGESVEPVTFSVGVFGGRRNKERENVHYAATLDNLINIASKNCQAAKTAVKFQVPVVPTPTAVVEAPAPEPESPKPPAYRVVNVDRDDLGPNGVTIVFLSNGRATISGADVRKGKAVYESVVMATAVALQRDIPGLEFKPDCVELLNGDTSAKRVTLSGRVTMNGQSTSVEAVRIVGEDVFKSVAEATIEAVLKAAPLCVA